MSLIVSYTGWFHYKDQHDIAQRVTPEALARNPRRFRRLAGLDYPVPWRLEGSASPAMGRTCHSWFAWRHCRRA